MARLAARVIPFGLLAATMLAVNVVKAHESYESLLYDKEKFSLSVPAKPHFILFFAPWCGHCKRLMPTWEDLYAKYNGMGESSPVVVARVDCTQESALCSTQDVTGYPTMKLFTPSNPEGVKYRGNRDLSSLEGWIREQLGAKDEKKEDVSANEVDVEVPIPVAGKPLELDSNTYGKVTKSGMHFVKFFAPWCGHCQRLAPVWDELAKSLEYEKSVTIGKVDCTVNPSICESVNVKGYPTLLWIKDGVVMETFSGERSAERLKEFVDQMREKSLSVGGGDGLAEEKVPKVKATESLENLVVELTGTNFENAVQSGVAFVKFYAPWCGHCKKLAPTWNELAKKFLGEGNVRICKVDCTQEQNRKLCEDQEVEGYPTLFLFKNGKKVKEYNDKRELDSLFSAVRQLLKDEL